MATGHEHEMGLALLLLPQRRRRWREMLTSGKTKDRDKLFGPFSHGPLVDPRYATLVSPEDLPRLTDMLRERGAPHTCHVMSVDQALDGREMALDEALESVVGSNAEALISCVPGVLAYYEGEEVNQRCILHRTGARPARSRGRSKTR